MCLVRVLSNRPLAAVLSCGLPIKLWWFFLTFLNGTMPQLLQRLIGPELLYLSVTALDVFISAFCPVATISLKTVGTLTVRARSAAGRGQCLSLASQALPHDG